MKQLKVYKTGSGREPYTEWLNGFDKTTKAKIKSFIDRIALGGSKKNLKPVGSGVYEIKIDFGPGYRIYFGEVENSIILLLLGGDKSTQEKDIKIAQFFWRNNNEQR